MRRWLLGTVVALQLLLAPPLVASSEPPQGGTQAGIVRLGGEAILTVQSAAGAQNPARLASHLSNEITSLAEDTASIPPASAPRPSLPM